MIKLQYFTSRRYRDIKTADKRICSSWFDDNGFYFFTKRPESLSPGIIESILNSSMVMVNEKDKPLGLIKMDTEHFCNTHSMEIEFRFCSEDFYTDILGLKIFWSFIYDQFYNISKLLNMIYIRVYSFDKLNIDFLEKLGIERKAELKEHIFKYDQYHDLFIYGVSKTEINEALNRS